jgi:hypothetical protein
MSIGRRHCVVHGFGKQPTGVLSWGSRCIYAGRSKATIWFIDAWSFVICQSMKGGYTTKMRPSMQNGNKEAHARRISSLVQGSIMTVIDSVVFSNDGHHSSRGEGVNIIKCMVPCGRGCLVKPSSESTKVQTNVLKEVTSCLLGDLKTPSSTKR